MEVKLKLTNEEHKDLVSYCNLNDLLISSVVKDSFTTGFNIERYGLLNASPQVKEKVVEKEIIKYVEVPKIEEKEVVKIEYIEVEKPIEIIKEIPVEKIVEVVKEVPIEKIVEIIKEVPVDKVVIQEVIKEVPVDKVVEKIVKVSDDTQINELLSKIHQLENQPQKMVEVIKEIPVEKVVVHEKRVEVPVERVVEVVKEVIIEKESGGIDKTKFDALQNTVLKLRQETLEKDKKLKEYENIIQEIQKFQENKQAAYFKGSNLDDKLYK